MTLVFVVSDLNCPEGTIYDPCTTPCPASCGSQPVSDCSDATCVEACRCPDGQLLDRGRCVEPEDCGCTLENGMYYPVRDNLAGKNVLKSNILSRFYIMLNFLSCFCYFSIMNRVIRYEISNVDDLKSAYYVVILHLFMYMLQMQPVSITS